MRGWIIHFSTPITLLKFTSHRVVLKIKTKSALDIFLFVSTKNGVYVDVDIVTHNKVEIWAKLFI